MHETTSRYLAAQRYARQVLGDDLPASRFERLKQLAYTLSRLELQAVIDTWAPKPKSDPEPSPEKPAPSEPEPEQWTPCKHFGGDRECPTCKLRNTQAGIRLAGALAIANELFTEHRAFVRDRLHNELTPYTNGKAYSAFDDLEQEVWQAVAARIARYEDRSTPLAWLKRVVHSVTADHFKRVWAPKRGVAVTGPLLDDPEDPDSPVGVPARPTRPPGAAPDGENPDDENKVATDTLERR